MDDGLNEGGGQGGGELVREGVKKGGREEQTELVAHNLSVRPSIHRGREHSSWSAGHGGRARKRS